MEVDGMVGGGKGLSEGACCVAARSERKGRGLGVHLLRWSLEMEMGERK